jgi:uncharacterized protein (TIGR03437 family)
MRVSVGISIAVAFGLSFLILAQPPATSVPFASTPLVTGWDGTAETIYVRQPGTGGYDQLQFGDSAPFGLLSSVSSLAKILSGSVQFSMNTAAGPAGVGRASQFMALADFTGDGSPGIAFAGPVSRNDSSLTINEFSPSFLFRSAKSYSYPNGSSAGVLAADFNGDGKADLAVAVTNETTNGAILIYLNKGDGTFADAVSYQAGQEPNGMATLDINHDGITDLVVASSTAGSTPAGGVYVLLGKGDGTFGAAIGYSLGAYPLSVTIGDFNGDGTPDVAVTTFAKTVNILLGAGNGTFTAGGSVATGNYPQYVAAGDFNKDGKLDLAVTNSGDQTVSVYTGDGKGGFQIRATYLVSYQSNSLIVTDFNGDGNLDIIQGLGDARGFGANSSNWNMDILLGNGDGTFQGVSFSSAPVTTAYATMFVTGDFNGDGKVDTVINDRFGGNLYLFSGNGDGSFQPPAKIPIASEPVGGVAGDFNGDGKLDLAVAQNVGGQITILLNSAAGLQPAVTFSSGGGAPNNMVAADFNHDGKLDLAVTNDSSGDGSPPTVAVFFGGGNGAFQLAKTYRLGSYPAGLAVADLNGDGFPDLVVTDSGETITPGSAYVLMNDGSGGFRTPQALAASSYPQAVSVADVNGDGKLDLVICTSDVNLNYQLAIALGNGDGTFQPASLTDTDFGPSATAVADFNGDGKVDIAVAHCCGDTDMTYLQGNGDGTFAQEVHFNGGPSPFGVAVFDLNGDGKPDLVIGDTYPLATVGLLNTAAPAATTVNGASFSADRTVAPASLASVFGSHLANGTSLSSSTVTIQDSSGASQTCTLFAVTPAQVNFLIPASVAAGIATITVQSGDGVTSQGTVTVAAVAPGIFTAGTSLLNGFAQTVDSKGNLGPLNYTVQLSSAGQFVAAPVAPAPAGGTLYLILFGTGIRGAAQSQVTVSAGGVSLPVQYAGTQGQFPGLDQINVTVPSQLKGAGDVLVTVTAAGKTANTVHLTVQ